MRWLVAVVLVVPVLMVVLTLVLPFPAVRWTCLVVTVALALALFNLVGLPYPGAYDNFLIVVGLGLNTVIGWQAWTWTA